MKHWGWSIVVALAVGLAYRFFQPDSSLLAVFIASLIGVFVFRLGLMVYRDLRKTREKFQKIKEQHKAAIKKQDQEHEQKLADMNKEADEARRNAQQRHVERLEQIQRSEMATVRNSTTTIRSRAGITGFWVLTRDVDLHLEGAESRTFHANAQMLQLGERFFIGPDEIPADMANELIQSSSVRSFDDHMMRDISSSMQGAFSGLSDAFQGLGVTVSQFGEGIRSAFDHLSPEEREALMQDIEIEETRTDLPSHNPDLAVQEEQSRLEAEIRKLQREIGDPEEPQPKTAWERLMDDDL